MGGALADPGGKIRGGGPRSGLNFGMGRGGGKRPARNGHVAVATYNIRDGRAAGLLSAARAFDHANVDLAVV